MPVSDELVRALVALRLASAWSRDGDLVFAGATGNPRHAGGLYGWFGEALTAAAVRGVGVGFHALRRSRDPLACRRRPARDGVELCGHADPAFTLRVYAGFVRDDVDLPDGDQLAEAVGR